MRQICVIARNTMTALVRKKDFYVFLIMLVILLLLLSTQSFFNIDDISRFVKDVGFVFTWLFSLIIAVTFSSKQLPEEIGAHTVLPLLAKPVSRGHLLTGRFLGSLSASAAAVEAIRTLRREKGGVLSLQEYYEYERAGGEGARKKMAVA